MTVFLLQHVHDWDDGHEDVKLIGVYSSRLLAESALQTVQNQPGFSALPQDFEISEHTVDRTSWPEGYVTVD